MDGSAISHPPGVSTWTVTVGYLHNDLPDVISSDIYLFADDTKISRPIMTEEDEQRIQRDLDKLTDWGDTWLPKYHPDKCKHMHIGGPEPIKVHSYTLHGKESHQVTEEKDNLPWLPSCFDAPGFGTSVA